MVLDLSNQRIKEEDGGQEAVGGEERNLNDFKNKIHVQSIQSIAIDTAIQPSEDQNSNYNRLQYLQKKR